MPDTDGYISNGGDGWEKTYWRNAEPEDVDPEGDAWVRVVAKHPLEGFKIDWNGAVGEGPAVDYSEPGEPLKSVGAEDPPENVTDAKNNSAQTAREYIKLLYVGISPRQQDVALMVLPSSFIKLINPKGITSIKGPGIDGVTQRGRLIIIQLDDAVSMSGNDYVLFEVAEGTFGITITVDTDREDGGNFFDCKAEEGDPCFDADGAIDQDALLQCLLRYDDIVAEHELEEIEEVPEAGGGCGNTERGKIDVPDLENYPLTEKVDEPVGNPGTDGSFTDPTTFTSPGSDFVADGIQPGDVIEINGERNTVDTVVDSNTVTFTAPVDAITQAGTDVEFSAVRPTPLTDETANQRDPCGNNDADRASVSYACPVQRSSGDDTDGTCTEDQEIDPRALCDDATDTDNETDTDTDADGGDGDSDQSGVVVDVLVTNPRWPVVPARTGSAFNLAQAKLCGCQESAPAWLVSYKYFGSTLPLEPAPLKKLFDSQSLSDFPNTVRAVAAEGGDTCGSGLTFSVVIQAVSGPYVTVPNIYNAGDFAVFPHQPGTLTYKCSSCCSVQDVSTFLADRVHNFVAEDIVKVTDRDFSVFGVANVTLGQTTIEIPSEFTDETFVLPTNILTDSVKLVTSVEFQNVNLVEVGPIPLELVYPTAILEDPARSYPTTVTESPRNYPVAIQETSRQYPTAVQEGARSYVTGIATSSVNLPTNYQTGSFSLPSTLGLDSISIPTGLDTTSVECAVDLTAVQIPGFPTGVSITPQTVPLTVCDAQGNSSVVNVWVGIQSATLTTATVARDLGMHAACTFDLPTALALPPSPLSVVTGEGPIQSVDFPTSVQYGAFNVPSGALSANFTVPTGVATGPFTVPTGIQQQAFSVPAGVANGTFTVPTGVALTTQSVDDLSVVSESVPIKWYTEIVNTPTEVQTGNVTIKQPVAGGAAASYDVLIEDPSGAIELLKKTDCESGDHKVIDRGDELIKMTVPIESIGNVCAPGNVSILVTDRETCDTVFFAVPKYLTHPSATASATRVPWYDGSGELSPSNPESFPNMQASPDGMATTNVVRVERTNAVRGVGMGRPL